MEQDLEKAKRRSIEHFNARLERGENSKCLFEENIKLHTEIGQLRRIIEEQNIEINFQRSKLQAKDQESERLRERILDLDRIRSQSRT